MSCRKPVLAASRKLAEEDKDIAAQATGQLRASSNLRLSPDRSGNENIMMRLDTGSRFEIVGWKRIPKPKSSEAIESDVAPKAGSAQPAASRGAKSWSGRDRDRGSQRALVQGQVAACSFSGTRRLDLWQTG